MERVEFTGIVACALAAPWEFPDDVTGEVRTGLSRIVFLAPAFVHDQQADPVRVKLSNDQVAEFEQLVEAGPGANVECVYGIVLNDFDKTKRAKMERRLLSLRSVKPAARRPVRAA